MKYATVFRRFDGWYFEAESTTTVGVLVGMPPRIKLDISKLDISASPDALGRAVLEALSGSERGIPHPSPKEAEKMFKPMLDLAGVKSWAAFAKHASNVQLSLDGEWLVIEPWRNLGPKEGFVQIPGKGVQLPADAVAAEIGEALRKTFVLCDS